MGAGTAKGGPVARKKASSGKKKAGSAKEPAWTGMWVWDGEYDLRNAYLYLRKVVELDESPVRAPVRVSADSRYKLWVNGEFVARGPARGFPFAQPYDEVDLAPYLRAGRNVICALAHHFGGTNFQYVDRGGKGFLLDGRAELPVREKKDGNVSLSTDGTWKCLRDKARRRRAARTSVQTGFQEHFDARLAPEGWLDPDFDDSAWRFVHPEGPVLTMPWSGMESRGMPLLGEGPVERARLLHVREGACAGGWEGAENVTAVLAEEERSPTSAARVTEGPEPGAFLINPAPEGRFTALVLDFGRETAGFPVIEVRGAHRSTQGGEVFDLAYMEYLKGGEFPPVHGRTGSKENMADRYVCREGDQGHEFYNLRGFRYMLLVARDVKAEIEVRPGVKAVGYPFEDLGSFECSDDRLVEIWKLCARTQRLCAFDAYVDCIWREQAQWWGDARIQGLITFYAFGDGRLLRRGIHQGAQSGTPEGLIWGVFPTDWPGGILPTWNLAWVLSLRDYVLYTGETAFARENFGVIEGILAYYRSKSVKGLAPGRIPGKWVFIDWVPLQQEGLSATHSLMWLLALQAAEELASWTRDRKAASRYGAEARKLASRIKRVLYDEGAGVVRESASSETLARSEQASQHANGLAVLTGVLKGKAARSALERAVLPAYFDNDKSIVLASPYFSAYVLEAMASAGLGEETVRAIRVWWGEVLDRGYTSAPEVWPEELKDSSSRCHAWSGSPVYLLPQILLGVRPLSPGMAKVEIRPVFAQEVESARGRVPTPRGQVEVSWARKEGGIELEVALPRGVAAELVLAGRKRLLRSGRHAVRL